MDLRSLEYPNRFLPHSTATSASRKVISRLILGLVASFSVLSIVFLNVWLKTFPALQGFNAYFPKGTVSCNRSSSSVTCILDHSMLLNGTMNGFVSKNGHEGVQLSDLKGFIEAEIDESHGKNGNFSMLGKHDISSGPGNVVMAEAEIDESRGNNRNFTMLGKHNVSAGEGNVVLVATEIEELHGKDGNFTMLGKHIISFAEGNEGIVEAEVLKSEHFQGKRDEIQKEMSRDCDLYKGRWVRDGSKPLYPQGSCPYVDGRFNCYRNKRPDGEFLKWRWKPYECEMPRLNGTDFLEKLRGQKLVFVGDSINRNMWESLICILRHSLPNKKRIYESRKKGLYAYYRFEDYKCTVGFVVSPFLVRESSFNGENDTSFETLRLDLMDKTTGIYQDANILIFNTGHWWSHEKTRKGVDYYQEGNHLYKRMRLLTAYTKALGTWSRWIDANINREKTQVIFRGYAVKHFWGGPWNSGGHCHEHTQPIFNETHLAKYPPIMQALERVIHKMNTPVVYLNITRLADFRKDGHPSIYRRVYKTVEDKQAAVLSQDCSHWCLPGVPDTWNELLYASLLQTGRGSWRN